MPLSGLSTALCLSTEITSFKFPIENHEVVADTEDNTITIKDRTITAVVSWGMSSSLKATALLSPGATGETVGTTNDDYSDDVAFRVTSHYGNTYDYTVSVLEIGYKEDEATEDEAKQYLTKGYLSHP